MNNEIIKYKKQLNEAFHKATGGSRIVLYNHDKAHNACVMQFMLSNSQHIRMFCGTASAFKKSFYDSIGVDSQDTTGIELRDATESAIREFFKVKTNGLEIIFEDENSIIDAEYLCFDEFIAARLSGQLKLYRLDSMARMANLPHFSFCNTNIKRLEQDKVLHTAFCSFGGDGTEKYENNFETLKANSLPILQ